jgi:hypothetical protein
MLKYGELKEKLKKFLPVYGLRLVEFECFYRILKNVLRYLFYGNCSGKCCACAFDHS